MERDIYAYHTHCGTADVNDCGLSSGFEYSYDLD